MDDLADVASLPQNTLQAFSQRRVLSRMLLDQRDLPWFVGMNTTLHDELDDAEVRERLRGNVALMRNLAATIVARAQAACPTLDVMGLPAQPSAQTPLFASVA